MRQAGMEHIGALFCTLHIYHALKVGNKGVVLIAKSSEFLISRKVARYSSRRAWSYGRAPNNRICEPNGRPPRSCHTCQMELEYDNWYDNSMAVGSPKTAHLDQRLFGTRPYGRAPICPPRKCDHCVGACIESGMHRVRIGHASGTNQGTDQVITLPLELGDGCFGASPYQIYALLQSSRTLRSCLNRISATRTSA